EAAEVRRDGLEDFLKDVGGVLVLKPPAAAPVEDERAVQSDQPAPCRRVIGSCTLQQTARRPRRGLGPSAPGTHFARLAHVSIRPRPKGRRNLRSQSPFVWREHPQCNPSGPPPSSRRLAGEKVDLVMRPR